MRAFLTLILLVAVERVAELVVSRRNLEWSKAHGGREFGAGHYPVMVALHTGLLVGAVAEARIRKRWIWPAFWVVVAAQMLRWWCITTLGRQWNTRVVVVPGAPRVTGGPYRVVPHPNYVAVVLEGAALPLAGGAWVTAALFSVANALLLRTRIRVEDEALQSLT
ncbi:isoprenylcysteine carboxyl methyltransferase family protein [Mycolicibacterium bacteremicum]|uniref:isoprenylcysteine carboxyl methyltransferase family protein n=1 Tax=Mycolicibacterium bacteremicum TaxID=564198 RepID=UPI0026ED8123|nr:isoprenylcysteine carboxylmethyltransferase family protein [Mycolicibacterium bacteremicum]